jgi:hypothetical protein
VYVTFIGKPERMDLQEFFEFKWEIVVYIATRYGMEGPGIESRWGRDFPHVSILSPWPTQPPVQWVLGLSRGKGDRGVVLTTYPRLVRRGSRKRVELCLYSL